MADLVFNSAKGKVAYYAGLPGASDGLVLIPLQATGLGTDATLRDLTTVAGILANATEHAMGRKVITTGVTVTPDNTNDRQDADFPDQTWTLVAAGQAIGAIVVFYDPDTTSGTDSELIPLTKHDFPVTPNGSDIVAQVSASGFYRAA